MPTGWLQEPCDAPAVVLHMLSLLPGLQGNAEHTALWLDALQAVVDQAVHSDSTIAAPLMQLIASHPVACTVVASCSPSLSVADACGAALYVLMEVLAGLATRAGTIPVGAVDLVQRCVVVDTWCTIHDLLPLDCLLALRCLHGQRGSCSVSRPGRILQWQRSRT